MNKTYQQIITAFGVIAFSMFLVAVFLYLNGNTTNAETAFGIGASVLGVALMMYSLRKL